MLLALGSYVDNRVEARMPTPINHTSTDQQGASFSKSGRYRYALWRTWNAKLPTATFITLMPHAVEDPQQDPDVEFCMRVASKNAYGAIRLVHLFGFCAKQPRDLYQQQDPVGPELDRFIRESLRGTSVVICAWGGHGKYQDRDQQVLAILHETGINPYAIETDSDGTPRSPKYVRYVNSLERLSF